MATAPLLIKFITDEKLKNPENPIITSPMSKFISYYKKNILKTDTHEHKHIHNHN